MNRSDKFFNNQKANKRKFMQILDDPTMRDLHKRAKKRGITVQELLRAVIIPEWLKK